jgi:hypothetical protein
MSDDVFTVAATLKLYSSVSRECFSPLRKYLSFDQNTSPIPPTSHTQIWLFRVRGAVVSPLYRENLRYDQEWLWHFLKNQSRMGFLKNTTDLTPDLSSLPEINRILL